MENKHSFLQKQVQTKVTGIKVLWRNGKIASYLSNVPPEKIKDISILLSARNFKIVDKRSHGSTSALNVNWDTVFRVLERNSTKCGREPNDWLTSAVLHLCLWLVPHFSKPEMSGFESRDDIFLLDLSFAGLKVHDSTSGLSFHAQTAKLVDFWLSVSASLQNYRLRELYQKRLWCIKRVLIPLQQSRSPTIHTFSVSWCSSANPSLVCKIFLKQGYVFTSLYLK